MAKQQKSGLSKYYHALRCKLPDVRGEKKKYLASIRAGVNEFLVENPNADMEDIYLEIGTVEELCEEYKNHLTPEQLECAIRRTKIRRVVCGVIFLAVAIFFFYSAWYIYSHRAVKIITTTEIIEVIEDTTETMEEIQ